MRREEAERRAVDLRYDVSELSRFHELNKNGEQTLWMEIVRHVPVEIKVMGKHSWIPVQINTLEGAANDVPGNGARA